MTEKKPHVVYGFLGCTNQLAQCVGFQLIVECVFTHFLNINLFHSQQQQDSFRRSQIDETRYEEPPTSNPNSRLLEDLSDRLEEALKALQVVREERDSLGDQVEVLKLASEVGVLQAIYNILQ